MHPSPRRLHGRRKGHRLRPQRQRLLAELLPEVRLELPAEGRLDPALLFHRPCPLWLEIGFGAGEHLAWQAHRHPQVGLIGCEFFINGVARLLTYVDELQLKNIRVLVDDARLLLDALPDRSLERIFVLFPDPWPKLRHHKRRLIDPSSAAAFARLLVPGGELRLATDDPSYARAMLLAIRTQPCLVWTAQRSPDWRQRSADWPPTRYEEKACAAGRCPFFFRYRRLRAPWIGLEDA